MKKVECIKAFLLHRADHPKASSYDLNMEVQVNVAQDDGERAEGEYLGKRWVGWTDGFNTWKSFRIPWNARTQPKYTDSKLNWPFGDHVEGIGLTGWDWKSKVSKWVAYDFDAIVGHSDSHTKKLTDQQLQEVRDSVSEIDYVTVMTSTSGLGIHIYIDLDDVPTETHTEHAALARAILGQLSAKTGFDFSSKVDVCGGNMWIWHRRQTDDGFKVLKPGNQLTVAPPNWRDHLEVVSNRKRRSHPRFADGDLAPFEDLTAQNNRVQLDNQHLALFKELDKVGASWWWDQDNWLAVCHTFDLKKCHTNLGLLGVFETISSGKEAGVDHNCFMYPTRKGGWSVRRFTRGTAEAMTWEQDGRGYTRCTLNTPPTLKTLARAKGGIELESGGFQFNNLTTSIEVAKLLGAHISVPENVSPHRIVVLKSTKDGRLSIEFKVSNSDPDVSSLAGIWAQDKKNWKKLVEVANSSEELEIENFDDLVRHIVSQDQVDLGWALKGDVGWRFEPLSHVKPYLKANGVSTKDLDPIVGSCIQRAWTMTCLPFEDEYPGNRTWNLNAPQLTYAPSQEDTLHHPHWSMILDHIGQNLDEGVSQSSWCKSNGIRTGSEYLTCWVASLFQQPKEPLPYLFLYGGQNSGKSILHEALELLVTKGVTRADRALTCSAGFNHELESSILCVVEETDLNQKNNKTAYNRIKDWVTAQNLSIRAMRKSPYAAPNTTHWIQCANDKLYCAVFPGDTRIVVIYVPKLERSIPKKELLVALRKEAPDFLAQILNIELPKTNDRLNIPVVGSAHKSLVEETFESALESHIRENYTEMPGHCIPFSEFYIGFQSDISASDRNFWTKNRTGREFPDRFPKGRWVGCSGAVAIGNICRIQDADKLEPQKEIVLTKRKGETWIA